ncbi:unnamed protein product [Mytilus edulis]|uniref:DZIP3-like HEPN domain-containing protein n=1 Tax=Mytilus edulis TaxID=6550 RepID=A0A8S3T631_MYTED|nr:unnamed protein product [Mytilus edulis]
MVLKLFLRHGLKSEVLPGTWFKGGKELSCSDYLDIKAIGKVHEIVIHRVTVEDRGFYSFQIAGKSSGDEFTPDKINYIRLNNLLESVAEPVVREIFDREIHPIEYSVKFKIKNYDFKRINQNKEEESKLRAEIEYVLCDLYRSVEGDHKVTVVAFEPSSLSVVLQLKSSSDENNLKQMSQTAVDKGKNVQAASKDFDIRLMMVLMKNLTELNIAEVFPHKDDESMVADLTRIKYLRNKIAQNSDMCITDEDFNKDWKHLSEAVEGLGVMNIKRSVKN